MRALGFLQWIGIHCCFFALPNDVRGDRSLQVPQLELGFVESLVLYNAITDQPIVTLTDGIVIDIAKINVYNFSIEATISGGPVGSVKFGYNGKRTFRTESIPPFALCGSNGNNFKSCSVLVVGLHDVTVTPYSGFKASGIKGTSYKLSFSIVNDALPVPTFANPTNFPSSAPVVQPTSRPPTNVPMEPNKCSVIPMFDSSWERFTPDYPMLPSEAQAEILGDDIFIFGSFEAKYTRATNRSYARDISGNNSPWRQMDDMPVAIGITHAAVVAIDTMVYVCGGYAGPASGPHVDTCFAYDHSKPPGTGQQWSTFPSLPNNGSGGGAMFYDSAKNAMFYTGGAQRSNAGHRNANDVTHTWKYSFNDPLSGWVASTAIPYAANHQSAVTNRDVFGQEHHFVLGGQIGYNEKSGNVAYVYEFIAATETWIQRASMPYGRSHISISTRALGCGFVVAGGAINGQKLTRTSDIHFYDMPSDSWTLIGSLPTVAATPPVFIGGNNVAYYVDHKRTSRNKIHL